MKPLHFVVVFLFNIEIMYLYNYLAFSIYQIFKRINKNDSHQLLIFTTSLIITLCICIVLFSIKAICELSGFDDEVFPNYYICIFMGIVWLPNYLYLKKEKFLNYDFSFNYKNGVFFLSLVLIILGFFITVANKNRERIFKKRGYSQEVIDNGGAEPFDPQKTPESLEGKIRLWYYNTFEE